MKLRYSQTSPYVRKVLMVAHETGLADRIELCPVNVWGPDNPIVRENPLAKIPTLLTEDGMVLFDSPVIAEYLDSLHGGRKLLPPGAGKDRWIALRQQALGDGICDAAVLRRMESLRPESLRSADWDSRQRAAMVRAFDRLEEEAGDLPPPDAPTIGGLAVLSAMAYLDFRFGHEPWRPGHPTLARWFEAATRRPSFLATEPPTE
ncbi:glutathione S-transferase N-terminal domain-containing protein [Niveispirillum sp. BGYR6]|uniref:glutathione S-transferase N-terminal domain-containing protein n=1 Tax=Niveispirillum sp. BGYR6 TaxID=2971249 RepID=UPI0022B97CC3|nr:glutathione S-transferase N-terminal domain-containing protein [Niveispirillum sp. BGYR6]MDG5495184.1 glutathione S-transferase N-terminal domain-containing protein [Niveispirillum sp. BGYR6]